MAIKTPSKPTKHSRSQNVSPTVKLLRLIDKQQALSRQLLKIMEELEDAEDSRLLDEAIKRDDGKPGIPWAEVKKRLGLD
jgi:hypothetical protein